MQQALQGFLEYRCSIYQLWFYNLTVNIESLIPCKRERCFIFTAKPSVVWYIDFVENKQSIGAKHVQILLFNLTLHCILLALALEESNKVLLKPNLGIFFPNVDRFAR